MYSAVQQGTIYLVLQMLLRQRILVDLQLAGTTQEERCQSSTDFSWLMYSESLTKTATYLNYYRILCTYSTEHIAKVGTSLGT